MRTVLFIGLGSALGGIARFLLSRAVQGATPTTFPLGTMSVNLLGCAIIGVCYALFERGNLMNSDLRLFLTVGFCGGFTTFSTFVGENFQLLQQGKLLVSLFYAAASMMAGLIALGAGYYLIKMIMK